MSDPPVDAVSGSALMTSCSMMAERTKLSGTPDEFASMLRIQAMLDGYGYRTTLLSHDAYISLPGEAGVAVGWDGADRDHAFLLRTVPARGALGAARRSRRRRSGGGPARLHPARQRYR